MTIGSIWKKVASERVSGVFVAVFSLGLLVGILAAIAFNGLLVSRSERISSYEEVAVAETVQRAMSVIDQANDGPDYDILSESAASEKKYDGTAFAVSMPIETKEAWIAWMEQHRREDRTFLEKRWDLSRDFIESKELWRAEDIRAFLLAPRELFVRERNKGHEYDDTWLPIGYGATITDPDVVAMMTSALAVQPGERVLEIGTGSGYQASILSGLSSEVYSIEIIKPLFIETDRLYRDIASSYPAFGSIARKLGDGYYGWDKYAPFDKIIVTCAIDHIPPPLLKQLAPNGVMVLPMGPPGRQSIMQVKKKIEADGAANLARIDVYNGLGVHFIPFTDENGLSYSASFPGEEKAGNDRKL